MSILIPSVVPTLVWDPTHTSAAASGSINSPQGGYALVRMDLIAGVQYHFAAQTLIATVNDANLVFYDASGNVIGGTAAQGDEADLSWTATYTGAVYAQVYNGSGVSGPFDLFVSNSAFSDVVLGSATTSYTGSAGQRIIGGPSGANISLGGAQEVAAGSGDDFVTGNALDDRISLGDGNDTALSGSGNTTVWGGGGVDTILGGIGNNFLYGDDGDDRIADTTGGIDTIHGGNGNDNLTAVGSGSVIYGDAGNDYLRAPYGNVTLDGGTGADTMVGGSGNNTFVIDNAGDTISEAASGGTDTVYSSVSYGLAAGVSVETLATTLQAGTANINLTGNELAQTINGNAGNNVLNGAGGIDQMHGLGGNDTYYVDNASDKVFEAANGGTDTVYASTTYILAAGQSIETLATTTQAGTASINLTGNEFAQTINGNAGANTLNGAGGVDQMHGLGGNDIYYVDNTGDQVFEAANGGSDTVYSSVSYGLAAGVSVETLATTSQAGTGAINLTGNELAQTINGNAGANHINGGAGNDTLTGRGGADTFVFSTGLNAATNLDHITDFAVDDTIDLENAIFTALTTTGTLASGAFYSAAGATSAHAAGDRIIYNSTTGALYYDADGNAGGATAVEFAVLNTHPGISNADFVVV